MKKPLDELLNECIARLESGQGDIEAVLGRYPEHADELRPHLQVWASLSAVERTQATAQGAERGRQQLLHAVSQAQRREGAHAPRKVSRIGGSSMRFAAVFVAGAALALAVTFFTGNLDFGGGSKAEAGPILDCVLQLDFNGDGKLDVKDVIVFRLAIKNQNLDYDLNGDDIVDIFDAVYAVKQVIICLQQIQPPGLP